MARTLIKTSGAPDTIADQSVGSVGSVANDQGHLVDTDFPTPASTIVFPLNGTADSTGSGPSVTLEVNDGGGVSAGTAQYVEKGFFDENLPKIGPNAQYFRENTNPATDPDGGRFSVGGWLKADNWATGANQILVSLGANTTDRVYAILINASNQLVYGTSTTGAGFDEDLVIGSPNLTNGSWHHFAMTHDDPNNLGIAYLDGQRVGTWTITTLHNPAASFGERFLIGAGNNGTNMFTGSAQDVFFAKGDTLTDAQINAIYSKRFTNSQQIAGGHVLTADSFPFADLTDKVYFWNLSDLSDGSGNGKTLTNNGSVLFNSLDLFGQTTAPTYNGNGSGDYFSINDADLMPGGTTPYSVSFWYNPQDWYTSTAEIPFTTVQDASNRALAFILDEGNISVRVSSIGTSDDVANFIALPDGITGWHHLAFRFDGVYGHSYFDGVKQATWLVGSIFDPVGDLVHIGGNAGVEINGSSKHYVIIKGVNISDEDIRKLASARVDLATPINPEDQRWEATTKREDSHIESQVATGWLVDKRSDKIYVDLGGASADKVTLKLRRDK